MPGRTEADSRGAVGRSPTISRTAPAASNRSQGFRQTPGRTFSPAARVGTTGDLSRTLRPVEPRQDRRPTTTTTYRSAPYRSGGSSSHGFYRPSPSSARHYPTSHQGRYYSDRHHRVSIDYHHSYHRSRSHHHHSGWGFYLGFSWNWYFGYSSVGYVQPYVAYYPWNFWWPDPVCVAYVPFGFYTPRPAVYVREVTVIREEPVVIREEVPVYVDREVPVYVDREVPVYVDGSAPGALVKTSEYREETAETRDAAAEPDDGPPLLDATTEKYLREGSEAFAAADYETAAEAFRNAANAAPDAVGPRFAYGQALIAIGDYTYASRILRDALSREPAILNAPASLVGVYRDAAEFQRVLKALRVAALENAGDPDLVFLLGYQQYFSGDPQAMVTFARMNETWPDDPALKLFLPVLPERFPALGELPRSDKLSGVK